MSHLFRAQALRVRRARRVYTTCLPCTVVSMHVRLCNKDEWPGRPPVGIVGAERSRLAAACSCRGTGVCAASRPARPDAIPHCAWAHGPGNQAVESQRSSVAGRLLEIGSPTSCALITARQRRGPRPSRSASRARAGRPGRLHADGGGAPSRRNAGGTRRQQAHWAPLARTPARAPNALNLSHTHPHTHANLSLEEMSVQSCSSFVVDLGQLLGQLQSCSLAGRDASGQSTLCTAGRTPVPPSTTQLYGLRIGSHSFPTS